MSETEPTVLKIILAETQKANNKLDKIEEAIARQDQMLIAHEGAILHLNKLVWADGGGLTTRVGQIESVNKIINDDITKVHLRVSGNESFKWSLLTAFVFALLGVCGSLVVWGLDQNSLIQSVQKRQDDNIRNIEKVKNKVEEDADNK